MYVSILKEGGYIMSLSEKALENKKKYSIEYAKQNYKRIPLDVTIDKYNQIKETASKTGDTVNGFIKKAIDERINDCK